MLTRFFPADRDTLKGKRFDFLRELNDYLKRWNRTIARLRIHGTTCKQVWTHFLETDKPALKPLASTRFAMFDTGTRGVHPDGHVEVAGAFYPVAPLLLGVKLRVRWDDKLVRIYHGDTLIASHLRIAPGLYAPEAGQKAVTSSQRAFTAKLLGRCERVGPPLRAWADKACEAQGVRALRLIQGVLGLTRKHPRESVLWAADKALEHPLFRYQDFKRLVERGEDARPAQLPLLSEHPDIRSMDAYRLEDYS